MTPLNLGQLVYTSFAIAGLRTVASKEVPPEIQQAFLEKVVYQYWDAYNPPSAGYRAAYLLQVTSEDNLFGWLYNDGLDDFGRSDVPYFLCYYLPGKLHPSQLENIFICLCTGPITIVDRQNLPVSLESLVTQNLWSYQPTRAGVKIPRQVIEESQITLKQEELLNLFVCASQDEIKDTSIADRNLLIVSKQKIRLLDTPTTPNQAITQQELPLAVRIAENDHQMPAAKTHLTDNQKAVFPFPGKLTLMLGTIATVVSLLTLNYFLKIAPFAGTVQKVTAPIPTPNPPVDQQSTTLTKTLFGHTDSVWSVALTKDGQTLMSASEDKTIKVWNLDTAKVTTTLQGHTDTVRAIALTPDDQTLISGSADKTIKIWNLQTFKLKRTMSSLSGGIWSLAISSDGQTLVTVHENGSIQIWNFPTGQLLRTIKGHQGRVFSVAMSPDGETFATGGIDKNIKIWNLYTGECLRTIAEHQDAVRALVFSHDGKMLVSSSWDQTIKIWQMPTGKLLHTLLGHTSRVVTLSLGIAEQTLVSGSLDNKLKIWNLQTGKLLETLSGHSDWILAIATNPAKQILVSSAKDKTIRVWQPQIIGR
ncbi:WD-40 repeat-containing protein [Trichormus variabilis ATCC 29413]|uniref:WD-40 repeat-containing protein n=2 Tax=Anabaena variabilis TaxID=264691 RepID=Q3MCX2_TRIV2|nr:WD40 repeat domain-containing protein [Trichormus variabilis]MBC1213779.1 WD40 repeat domain-containing protein [Trichormus variabilis ARAD]MBC1254771.1 WD40 repeat domain-containing protein [Trichormus variabilis V5]MBC1266952.1 WD40 repeat domain-containing protein [Trichormus variabilis FSR]MBC1301498.1 WD40 repeat domain-containing protein [Trichormus variabilis N2B]MBC1326298.1 WD40 repeat domain-containing protein [Trichormus variabilis 9RC]MBD2380635.1 WD40 repeat domain-containing 